jgi:rubrerythrin
VTLLDEALALLRELRPHAPIERAWLTDPRAPFDEEAWRNSPVATSSKLRDKVDNLLARAEKETAVIYWTCPKCQVENRDDYHRISCPHCASMRPTANR